MVQQWEFMYYLNSRTFSVYIHYYKGWEFYLFLREGYYKDAKLKGEIKFDHEKSHQIVSLNFSSPVLHPLVNF